MVEQKPLSQKVIITNTHGLDFDPSSSTQQLPKDLPRPDFELQQQQQQEQEQQEEDKGYGRAIQLLLDDHSLVNSLYQDEFVNMNESRSEQKLLVTRMIKEMTVHIFVEEAIIHPLLLLFVKERSRDRALMSYSQREELVNLLRHENHLLMVDMQQLLNMDPEDSLFIPLVNNMIESWRKHVEIQEGSYFANAADENQSSPASLFLTYLNNLLNSEQKELLFYALTDARTIAPHVPLSVSHSDWLSGPNAEAWERLKSTFEI